jgi:glycosyltransferase involved in cell wall biosynthesis
MARRLRSELRVPILCNLQGEDWFLDSLPAASRDQAWHTVAARAADVDLFIAPSRYFASLMQKRLRLPAERVRVLHNGINLDGFHPSAHPPRHPHSPPTLGYFARMCREKGLENLVDAFVILKKRDQVKNLKLRVGGSCGPVDQVLVDQLRARLAEAGVAADAEFLPNPPRAAKLQFLSSLSVFSVPATYSEAFGLYVIEALAAGIPVVQPGHSAFPELIAATGGGLVCPPHDPGALAAAIESLLADPPRARALGEAGRKAVAEKFSVERMAREMAGIFADAIQRFSHS